MKSYDFNTCIYNGNIYCNECLPENITTDIADPIFADSEWDYIPNCCVCGQQHDYIICLN
jgi:hypothetical protein